jgi:hypothetical protein
VLEKLSVFNLFSKKQILDFDLQEFDPGQDPVSPIQIALKALKAHSNTGGHMDLVFEDQRMAKTLISKSASKDLIETYLLSYIDRDKVNYND